jgi:CTD small phosphatase-like protein 2
VYLQTKWRGHLGALFSPVLKMFAADGSSDEAAASDERRQAEEEAARVAAAEEEVRRVADAAAQQQQQQEEAEDDDDEGEFNPYLFIKQLPSYHEARGGDVHLAPRLPPRRMTRNTTPVTLVLDLDETLVHCSVEGGADSDLIFPVNFNGVTYQVGVKMRPHMERFLRAVADKFEVVVFTASQQVYADTLLDIIDPQRELIKHRLFRDSCLLVEGNYLKDLNVLGRDLAKTVLVDNSPHAFGYQVDNGIPIESWFDDPNDTELLKLATFLESIQDVDDVRPLVRAHFKQFELVRDAR